MDFVSFAVLRTLRLTKDPVTLKLRRGMFKDILTFSLKLKSFN